MTIIEFHMILFTIQYIISPVVIGCMILKYGKLGVDIWALNIWL